MEYELKTERMESVKALSEINLKISEAQNTIFNLQEEETKYLTEREQKAIDRIKKAVADSKELFKEAKENHQAVKELSTGITEFSSKLLNLYQDFHITLEEFDLRNTAAEKYFNKQEQEIAEIRKEIKTEKIKINNDKKSLIKARKELENDQKKLASDRGTLQRAVERLKQGKI